MKKCLIALLLVSSTAFADDAKPRARDLGIPFDGTPGELNAITDVAGVTVGHSTIIEDFEDGRASNIVYWMKRLMGRSTYSSHSTLTYSIRLSLRVLARQSRPA